MQIPSGAVVKMMTMPVLEVIASVGLPIATLRPTPILCRGGRTDPGNDFTNEVHDYFGTGTQLQEIYITPSLLTTGNWDVLAEAAKWSRQNADVLKDTHRVGGDPNWLNVYGWASWSPKKSILVLRNPSDKPQSITIDLRKVLELPAGTSESYSARSPWKSDGGKAALSLSARTPHQFDLEPFEVLTLDLQPK